MKCQANIYITEVTFINFLNYNKIISEFCKTHLASRYSVFIINTLLDKVLSKI